VDIVVLVDDSGGMREEQDALVGRFPELIRRLVEPPDADADGRPDHPPVADLNIGVISQDMGTAGFALPTCTDPDHGDRGCFLPPGGTTCTAPDPPFLSRNPGNAAAYPVERMSDDFACLASLGTSGCAFEQPLEAMLRAVTDNARAGGCNAGFLRDDSVLALVFVSDEDDRSASPDHPELFDPARNEDLGHVDVRGFLHPEFLRDVEEYVAAFQALRPDDPDRVVLGFIIGVPPDAPACVGSGETIEGCLGAAAMTEMIAPAWPTGLVPSCNTSMGLAFPPRRLVELALAAGRSAYVDSICKHDWTEALRAIADLIGDRLAEPCLRQILHFDFGSCEVIDCWLLETLSDDGPCADDPACPAEWCPPATGDDYVSPPPCTDPDTGEACTPLERDLGTLTTTSGRIRRQCLVRQARRDLEEDRCGPPLDEGWYYVPPSWSEHECPELVLDRREGASLDGWGASLDLRCMWVACPEELTCGSAAYPGELCCASGEVCRRARSEERGTCEPEP
jgi:hypothetical protein